MYSNVKICKKKKPIKHKFTDDITINIKRHTLDTINDIDLADKINSNDDTISSSSTNSPFDDDTISSLSSSLSTELVSVEKISKNTTCISSSTNSTSTEKNSKDTTSSSTNSISDASIFLPGPTGPQDAISAKNSTDFNIQCIYNDEQPYLSFTGSNNVVNYFYYSGASFNNMIPSLFVGIVSTDNQGVTGTFALRLIDITNGNTKIANINFSNASEIPIVVSTTIFTNVSTGPAIWQLVADANTTNCSLRLSSIYIK